MQVKAVSYITERLESLRVFADVLEDNAPSLTEILCDCKTCATPDVSVDTLQRWWNVYQEWGELPYKVAERKKKMKGNIKYAKKNELLDDNDVLILKSIVDNNPNHYLDELAFLFGVKTGTFVHYSTIRQSMKEKLNYSLQWLTTIAKQQSKDEETRYMQALDILL